jgi:hypothetical protein
MRTFLRTFLITTTGLVCFCILYFGLLFSFETIKQNGFGKQEKGIEITTEYVKFLDFSFDFPD